MDKMGRQRTAERLQQESSRAARDEFVISTPSEHRAVLMAAMVALLENRLPVAHANALVGLSAEVHKSIKSEFEMCVYVAENVTLDAGSGRIVRLIDGKVLDA